MDRVVDDDSVRVGRFSNEDLVAILRNVYHFIEFLLTNLLNGTFFSTNESGRYLTA